MMKVILFMDGDKDDLYALTLLVAQHYYKRIFIMGVVLCDGFFSYPENVSITNFWLKNILKYDKIRTYSGMRRDDYLRQERKFPDIFLKGFIDVMTEHFGYQGPNTKANDNSLNELVHDINKEKDESIRVLTTGNLTTLSYLLDKYKFIKMKIASVLCMGGNYKVKGNIVQQDPSNPKILLPDSEYNFYLDPTSALNVISHLPGKIYICPLDCTNYAPLTLGIVDDIRKIGDKYLQRSNNEFINNLYRQFIKLLRLTLFTQDADLYLWDLVATVLFLGNDIKQEYAVNNISIDWTGRIIDSLSLENNSVVLYTFIDFERLKTKAIENIFYPIPESNFGNSSEPFAHPIVTSFLPYENFTNSLYISTLNEWVWGR